jgi:hypothetical protein
LSLAVTSGVDHEGASSPLLVRHTFGATLQIERRDERVRQQVDLDDDEIPVDDRRARKESGRTQ